MRVVFMGFQTSGLVTLRALIDSGHEVTLVVTHFDSMDEYEVASNYSVKDYADQHGIPVIQCRAANNETVRKITKIQPDIIVSSNWRRRISSSVTQSAQFGGINVHPSLLPKYGGFAPISWAIINGEVETGITIHIIDEEIDLGDIILQERVAIGFNDTATEVFHRTTPLIARMVPEALHQIGSRTAIRIPQDRSQATFFHKRLERDIRIDWTRTNIEVYNLVRAQSDPFPNTYTFLKGNKLRIKKASLADPRYRGTPGRVFTRTPDGVVVLCGSGNPGGQGLVIHIVQSNGGEQVTANDYFDRMGYYLGK